MLKSNTIFPLLHTRLGGLRVGIALLVCVSLAGCDMDDQDRCSDGLILDKSTMTCIAAEEDTGSDTGSDELDAGGDGSPDDVSGLGEPCESDADCAGYDADLCALNPLAPDDPGYCTLEDCSAGECPDGYLCCDCSNFGLPVACATDADAESLSGVCTSCN